MVEYRRIIIVLATFHEVSYHFFFGNLIYKYIGHMHIGDINVFTSEKKITSKVTFRACLMKTLIDLCRSHLIR